MGTQGSRALNEYRLFTAVITVTQSSIVLVLPHRYIRRVKPFTKSTGKTARYCEGANNGYIRYIKLLAGTTS